MPKAADIQKMFDSVVGRYDLLNRILSLGRDASWRKALAGALELDRSCCGLDLCCGTGDVALRLLTDSRGVIELVAADFSPAMCRAANKKLISRYQGGSHWWTACADGLRLPFGDAAFDFATVAFGVRNFEDLEAGLAELARVIRPGGRLGLLEFAPPRGLVLKSLYRPYMAIVPPILGRLLASSPEAYRYLFTSIDSFLEPGQVTAALNDAGFHDLQAKKLTFGITYLYTARSR